MKKILRIISIMVLGMMLVHQTYAQSEKANLGNVRDFANVLSSHALKKSSASEIPLKVSSKESFKGKLNVQKDENGRKSFLGNVPGQGSSSFAINIDDNEVTGEIVLFDKKKAYRYSTDPTGSVFIEEVDINDVVCIEYRNSEPAKKSSASSETIPTKNSQAVLTLQSLPGAVGVLYLDTDGEIVSNTRWNQRNNNQPIVAAHPNLSDAQIREAWEVVAEDYMPLNINVTTDVNVFNRAPMNRRMSCIITPTNTAAPGAGGVAYLHSFAWNSNDPCWAFITSNGKSIGEVVSHEFGHTLGLSHDGRTSPSEGYYQGHGSWAPIMGVGYYRNIVQWSKGEYANANNTQDDLAIMAGTNFGLGYRTDDHGNNNGSATPLRISTTGTVSAAQNFGVIERNTDVDVFSFTTSGGSVNLSFNTVARHANLDILLRVYNQSNSLVATINPTNSLSATYTANLTPGTYYVHVTGTGNGNPLNTGYSDYASLGRYTVSGTISGSGTVNQPPVVSITSPGNNASFNAPATVNITANASDPDGTVSKVEFYQGSTKIGEKTSSPWTFTWSSVAAGSYTLTARATDNQGATTVSSPISISVVGETCSVPSNFRTSNVSSNSATVTWNAVSSANSYLVWYRVVGQAWSANTNVSSNSIGLTDLLANTEYELAVRSNCSSTNSAYATPYFRFRTSSNLAPVVSITSPSNNATFTAPASFTITASATDADGTVAKVEFFNGETKLGEKTTAPWTFAYSGVAAGTYSLTARATDNLGATATSAVVTVVVNQPATCDAPKGLAANSITESSASLVWEPVSAATSYLVWYRVVGQAWSTNATVSSNSLNLNNLQAGTQYEFTLRSNCASGNSPYATPYVRFTTQAANQAPVVSITSPTANAQFTAPASITITASASDPDGTVSKVEFFSGTTKLGERTSAPWTLTFTNVEAGTYNVTAVATDNLGLATTSSPVTIVVSQPVACLAPSGLKADNITENSASLSWNAVSSAGSYLLWYRIVGQSFTVSNSMTVQGNSVTISGLESGTEYEFTLRSNCSGTNSAYSTPYVRFTTSTASICTEGLGSATNGDYSYEIYESNGEMFAIFKPEIDQVGARYAIIHYRIGFATQINSYVVPNQPFSIGQSGNAQTLTFAFTYSVNSFAQRSTMDFMSAHRYSIGACQGAAFASEEVALSLMDASFEVELSHGENPFFGNTEVFVQLSHASDVELTIHDNYGNLITNLSNQRLEAGKHSFTVDLRNQQPGYYICKLKANGENKFVRLLKL